MNYFLRMVLLYSNKICELSESSSEDEISGSLSYLKGKEKELLLFLIKKYKGEFTPIEVSREIGVTNKTVINRLSVLVKNGFVEPLMVNQRIRSYELSDFTRDHNHLLQKGGSRYISFQSCSFPLIQLITHANAFAVLRSGSLK